MRKRFGKLFWLAAALTKCTCVSVSLSVRVSVCECVHGHMTFLALTSVTNVLLIES